MLGNSNLGVQELFTKLLQEPLGRSTPCQQRKLVIIDALDETQHEFREDFLDLIMHRFPLLPKWLVFFITSRPEETVQFRLNKYNPCIKICAGSCEDLIFYQQHEQDIKLFLEKSVDFSHLPYSAEDITKKCNGLFLYAFYIARVLKDPVHSGKIDQVGGVFPRDIDNFFRQNFKRVFDKVGANLYNKLFGCAIVAPSPLPVSFISFILQRENSALDEQEVIDAVSQFVVLRTSDQTFTFLHNLIPTWLTDKKKASRTLFIDRIKAGKYFRDVIVEILSAAVVKQSGKPPSIEADLFDYCFRVGVRFLCEYREKDSLKIVFSCFTSYQFIWKRIQNNGIEIYSVIADLKLATGCQRLSNPEKDILQEICLVLESNVHILQECPHLLHYCLRNASKAVQVNVVIPDGVSTTWMERKVHPNPASEIPCDVRCFALSPDKKLLAGGKEQYITLFDACSFGKIQGPFKVIESGDEINHLEFSPDGEYVFFGRLDRWFSVKGKCVNTLSQFSGEKTRCYKWGCFASFGSYIVVKGEHPLKQSHSLSCLVNIFCRWATQELLRVRSSEITLPYRANDYSKHFRYSGYTIKSLQDLLSVLKTKHIPDWCRFLESHLSSQQVLDSGDGGGRHALAPIPLCPDCDNFYRNHRKRTLAVVRQRVIDLYPEIFEYQVWNVRTGKPALEEAFSSDVVLSPFFHLCHMMTALEDFNGELFLDIDKTLSFHSLAFIIVVYFLLTNVNEWRSSVSPDDSFLGGLSFFTEVPIDFHNRPTKMQLKLSLDGKWIAIRERSQSASSDCTPDVSSPVNYKLFETIRFGGKAAHVSKDVQQFAFTDDSTVFLYATEDKSLHAIHLETGISMLNVSGFCPLLFVPEKQLGYIFYVQDEETVSFAENFRSSLPSFILSQPGKSSVKSIFIPASTILSSISDAVPTSWKITQEFPVKKCVFSQDGNLIVTHQGTKILLFDFGKFVCSFCDDRYDEDDVSCLTFSPDNTLLLYFIQQKRRWLRTHDHDFYVWDVKNRVLSASFDSPSGPLSIDCCCFSSDNTKLIICGEFSFEVWEYASGPCRLLTKVETNVLGLYTEVDKFTHCTVSPESDLLACCIVDRILIYKLNSLTNQSVLQLPRAHLGKIEFCQFLKGNRYLISYGVDGTVFLWDLSEWKAIAYAKIGQGRESIVGMAVAPEEDKVFCVTSFGRLNEIKLCGLKCTRLSGFQLSKVIGSERMTHETRGQVGEPTATIQSPSCLVNTDVSKDLDVAELIEEMDFMLYSDDSEDSDEPDELQD